MRVLAGVLGFVVLATVIADAFQTVVVARHAQKLPAMTRVFYRSSWIPFVSIARLARSGELRERVLGLYGPLSLLILLVLWAVGVIVPFAMLQWSTGLRLAAGPSTFANDVYFSGAAFFTLGSDQPVNLGSRYLMLLESGFGLSFLGLVIGYLPVLYQSFSSRELKILLLDARAGSPPSALEFLLRRADSPGKLAERLEGWEEWALELLQTHLSYPMLAYYRSQHSNQSWLAALVAVVDVSALAMVSGDEDLEHQAALTFAAGRHALVHTASLFEVPPRHSSTDPPAREGVFPPARCARYRSCASAARAPLGSRAAQAQGDVRAVRGGSRDLPRHGSSPVDAARASVG